MRGEHDGRDRAAGERSGRQEAGMTPAKTGEQDASTAFRVESLIDSHRGNRFCSGRERCAFIQPNDVDATSILWANSSVGT